MPSYSVNLGKVERTILYEDSFGTILFCFDLDTTDGRNFLILERPLSRLNEIDAVGDERVKAAQRGRVTRAFDRTKQHLIEQGHQVKVWPDEFEKPPKTAV
jgi:hypothetical protein